MSVQRFSIYGGPGWKGSRLTAPMRRPRRLALVASRATEHGWTRALPNVLPSMNLAGCRSGGTRIESTSQRKDRAANVSSPTAAIPAAPPATMQIAMHIPNLDHTTLMDRILGDISVSCFGTLSSNAQSLLLTDPVKPLQSLSDSLLYLPPARRAMSRPGRI